MDETQLKQIIRQLKILNFWVTFFGIVIVISFVIAGVALYKVASYTSNTVKRFDNFQAETAKSLNVKQQLCNDNSLKNLLSTQTSFCK